MTPSQARSQDSPSVDRLLRREAGAARVAAEGHALVAGEARSLLDGLRALARDGRFEAAAPPAADAQQQPPAAGGCSRW